MLSHACALVIELSNYPNHMYTTPKLTFDVGNLMYLKFNYYDTTREQPWLKPVTRVPRESIV